MGWHTLKTIVAAGLTATSLALLLLALDCHRRRRPMPAVYYSVAALLQLQAAGQIAVGVYLLWRGFWVPGMHLVYAALLALGAVVLQVLAPFSPTGQAYRNRPLVHALVALFLLAVAVRAWWSAL